MSAVRLAVGFSRCSGRQHLPQRPQDGPLPPPHGQRLLALPHFEEGWCSSCGHTPHVTPYWGGGTCLSIREITASPVVPCTSAMIAATTNTIPT
jgi:hypothetical protein